MERFFEDLRRHAPFTPTQERVATERVVLARQDYWRRLLTYPPLVVALVQQIQRAKVGVETLGSQLAGAAMAGAAMGGRPDAAARKRAAPALEALAVAMADADPGSELADQLAADVQALASGRSCALEVRRPSASSKAFADAVAGICSARAALGAARSAVINANLRLVVKLAERYRRRAALPLADLVQEGSLGLITAVDRFDPRRGFRFSTYATFWIRHALGRAIADKSRTVRLPVHAGELRARILRERTRVAQRTGRAPTLAELSEELQVPVETIERLDRAPTRHQAASRDEGGMVVDPVMRLADDSPPPSEYLDDESIDAAVDDALEELRPLELDILRRRFGLDEVQEMTLREVGDVHGLSRERIRQLQNVALGKVREHLHGAGIAR